MEDIRLMQIFYRADQVVDDGLDVLNLQVDIRLYDLLKIRFSVFYHYVQRVKMLRVNWVQDLNELDHERMAQLVHEGDLSQDALSVGLILEDVFHALYRHFAFS